MFKFVLTFSLVFSFSALAQQRSSNLVTSIIESVHSLSSKNLRCNESTDCEVIALGALSCGGHEAYTVISRYNDYYDFMKKMAANSVKMAQLTYARSCSSGDASILPMPEATCFENSCQFINE